MSTRSRLITLDLNNDKGDIVPFYTYDGYLEEHDRKRISQEKRNFELLRFTGAAIFGYAAFLVTLSPNLGHPQTLPPSPQLQGLLHQNRRSLLRSSCWASRLRTIRYVRIDETRHYQTRYSPRWQRHPSLVELAKCCKPRESLLRVG